MPGYGHSDKKPKMIIDTNKLKDSSKKALLEGVAKKAMMFKSPKMVDDIRPKMAMPKMVDSSNFPKMAQDMAMAMDYNSSKPMMYGGDKPKMDHGKAKMQKPKAYHDKK